MILRALIIFGLAAFLHGCTPRPVITPNLPVGVPLAELCQRYHVSWQWDGLTQVVLLDYHGNQARALVGSSMVLVGEQKLQLSMPVQRSQGVLYVPEDFEAKVLAPFGVVSGGLPQITDTSSIHTVVIDPGHGGKDTGTRNHGINEKDIVLDIGKRLNVLLERAGLKVIMTRHNDTFISLQERTEIATRQHADLFMSIHVNTNQVKKVHGLIVYYLDRHPKSDLEQRHANEHWLVDHLKDEPSRRLQSIVADMMNTLKLSKSQELARIIAKDAGDGKVETRGDGMRICRFFVVRNTLVPAVLVETGFLSNAGDRRKLTSPAYRQKLAEVLARSVLDYANQ